MKKRTVKLAALFLAAGFTFGCGGISVLADETAGTAADTGAVGTNGFAQCSDYLNVRASADQEGELVGLIPNNGIMEILEADENGWYHVRSGNVEGYVASQFVATGAEADKIAASSGYTTAEVGAEVLNVRSDSTEEAAVVGVLEEKQKAEVVDDCGEWIKVVLEDGTYGYVSHDYVHVSTEYRMGETLEEVQARLDREAQAADAQTGNGNVSESAGSDWSAAGADDYSGDYPDDSANAPDDYSDNGWDGSGDYSDGSADASGDYSDGSVDYSDGSADASGDDYSGDSVDTSGDYQDGTTDDSGDYSNGSADSSDGSVDYSDGSADASGDYSGDSADASGDYSDGSADASGDYSDGSGDSSSSSTGQAIADYACQFVGNPYAWGGISLTNGADCSGFVMSVFANFGISLPHNAASQSGYGTAVDSGSLQAGDLVFYSDGTGISHVAIYIGGGQIVHAANSNSGIITSSAYYSTPTCYRRLV